MPESKKPSTASAALPKQKMNWPATIFLIVIVFAIIVFLYYWSPGPVALRVLLAIVVLIVAGEDIMRINKFVHLFYGTYMTRSKAGLGMMDKFAKNNAWFWNGLADWGLVMGFGLLSYFMFRGKISKRMILFGTASILMLLLFALPYAILSFAFINIPQITSHIGAAGGASAGTDWFVYALYVISAVGGFVLYAIAALAYNAASIVYGAAVALYTTLTSTPNYALLNNSVPGVAPIIPGITIPLLAGLLSLALILAVHEFSHGVLARIAKIKVKSTGLLVFGIIPIGAFVEPDEKKIKRLREVQQNRISAAGVASNMLLSIIVLIPMLLMFYFVMPHYTQSYVLIQAVVKNAPANVLTQGAVLLKWNGYNISTISNLSAAIKKDTAYSRITVNTTDGNYSMIANSTGKIGVYLSQGQRVTGGAVGGFASFLYTFLALSFLLSFLVAVVNYIPIPSFDGWRIFNTSIKNKKTVYAMAAFVVIIIVINVLPWIWLA